MPRAIRGRLPSIPLLLTCLFAQAAFIRPAHATLLQLTRLFLVSRLPDEAVATPDARTSTPELPVTLHVVLEGRAPGRAPTYFTDAPAIDLGWGRLPAAQVRPWDNAVDGAIDVRWGQLEPEARGYDNTTPTFHLAPIAYREVELEAARGRWSWPAAIHPTLLPDPAPDLPTGLGVMRFKTRIDHQGTKLETAGQAGSFPGGMPDGPLPVTYRGIDPAPLVSWLQARFQMPYVHGPLRRGRSDDSHQAMLGLAADSVDLITAAWRLAGHLEVAFNGPFLLEPEHELRATVAVNRARPSPDGYLAQNGERIEVGAKGVLPGDLLRSGDQVGAYARDLPPLGVMDGNDLVIAAIFQEPRIQPLHVLLDGPVTILRWNEIRELQIDLKALGLYNGPVNGRGGPALAQAVAAARLEAGLEAIDPAGLEALLAGRFGTVEAVPAAARFDLLRRRLGKLKLDGTERKALVQRILARAAEAAGPAGLAEARVIPPREGLDARLWARSDDEPFRPEPAAFWELDEALEGIAWSSSVADADRDGRVDALGAPATVLAPGPAVVVGMERGWDPEKPAPSAGEFGNQVWLYLPRADLLLGYLQLGEVAVRPGEVVEAGKALGTVGRTGREGSRKKSPTRLRVVAFRGADGALRPVDPAGLWGTTIAAHPFVREVAVGMQPPLE